MAYNGPGNVGELKGQLLNDWRDFVDRLLERGVAVARKEANLGIRDTWFFNMIAEGIEDGVLADITWTAFPRRLQIQYPNDGPTRWKKADDNRGRQEEYCEWIAQKENNKLLSATFTTEVPDYYDFLARRDPKLLVNLYREFTGGEIDTAELVENGQYAFVNRYNEPSGDTIIHMGCNSANTLGAAVALSAEATWPSVDASGNPITSEQGLIDCRSFGERVRHSDPHIGARINALVRAGNRVSFPGPVGLYIHDIDWGAFEMPDGSDPTNLLILERGTEGFMMRVKIAAPNNAPYSLSDVLVNGEPLQFASQIAEVMTIRIRGLAIPAASSAPEISCEGVSPLSGISPAMRMNVF